MPPKTPIHYLTTKSRSNSPPWKPTAKTAFPLRRLPRRLARLPRRQPRPPDQNTWLIIYKKDSGTPSLTYEEARDEALCYGWVDSKPNKRAASSYYLFFAKRNPKSSWSRVNKERIAALEAAGKLAPPGLAMVAEAKKRGTWDALNDVEDLIVPEDMQAEFSRVGTEAKTNWDNFPPSVRRGILEWIFNAKRPSTREKRIRETVDMASRNERANQFR